MTDTIKITSLSPIGNAITGTSLVPVVDMVGEPTTKKATVANLANAILSQAGNGFVYAAKANLANVAGQATTVTQAAQPNITSVGTLTSLTVSGETVLGPVGNVVITGGTNGFFLQTDGTGNLTWSAAGNGGGNGNATPGGANSQIQFNDGGSFGGDPGLTFNKITNNLTVSGNIIVSDIQSPGSSNVSITAGSPGPAFFFTTGGAFEIPGGHVLQSNGEGEFEIKSTSGIVISSDIGNTNQNFSFRTDGVFNAPSNVELQGTRLSIGPGSANVELEAPTVVINANSNVYVQAALTNENPVGSADWVAYGAEGNDAGGWSDFGFDGYDFNDPAYTLTAPGDGYFFVQGYANGVGNGSLVLATGDQGTEKDIIFGTGGFLLADEFGRISHANNSLELNRTGASLKFPDGSEQTTAFTGSELGNLAIDNYNIYNTTGQGVIISNFNFLSEEAETAYVQIPAGNSSSDLSVVQEQGNVRLVANSAAWNFDTSGNLTLPNNTFAIKYANGTLVPLGGGNSSALVNGGNSFVLDSDGSVTFEGADPGEGVNRGMVWDYGAVANGVNSEVRQDINGLTVRAWTENGGGANGFSAPARIVTNQDATENVWLFDGQGNLTLPGNINAINDGGQLGAQVLLQPDLGQARLAARTTQSVADFNSSSWSNAEYTSSQVNFIDAPNLLNFVSNNSSFNASVDRTFSINGGEPLAYQGYGASGNNVIIYTDIAADPDPTVVTTIDFYYQLQSYIGVDYDDGGVDIIGAGLSINIDNDQTQGPDINLRSGDDITIQAKDKSLGSESEGGDINIYAGDGAGDDGTGNFSSSGGDIQIVGGQGGFGNSSSGSQGGFTRVQAGDGGDAGVGTVAGGGGYVQISAGDGGYNGGNAQLGAQGGYVQIYAGQTTIADGVGGNVSISSGTAGDGNGIAGNVQIITPTSATANGGTWTFDGRGNLNLPLGGSISEGPSPSYLGNAVTITPAGGSDPNQQLKVYPTVAEGNHLHLTSGNLEVTDVFLGDDRQYIRTTTTEGMTIGTGGGEVFGGYVWSFDDSGTLTLPNGSNIADGNLNGGTASASVALNAFSPSGDTVSVQAQGNTSSAVISIFSNAGPVTSNWTFTTAPLDPSESFLYIPNGGTISTPNATDGEGGKNIFIVAGASDPDIWNSNPGGEIFIKGGYGSFGDGGGGAGGDVNIEGGPSSDSHAGNVNINSGLNTWVFDYNGNLTVPGNLVYIGASPAPSISGFNSVSAEEFTNDTSNVTINANSNTWNFDSTGNLTIPGSSGGVIKTVANGAIAIAAIDNGSDNPAQLLSINANGTATTAISSYANQATIQANINGDIKTWAFTNTGNLVLPGNTFSVNYANGTQVSLGGGSSYGDSNVVSLLSSFGSNTITTTGNVSAGNIIATNIGNISAINLTGSSSNVLYGNGVFAAQSVASGVSNGTSNINISTANGNVQIVSAGNTIANFTGTGSNFTGTLNATGSIQSNINITANNNITAANVLIGSNLTINAAGSGQLINLGGGFTLTNGTQAIDIAAGYNTSNSAATSTVRILPNAAGSGSPTVSIMGGLTGAAGNIQLGPVTNTTNGITIGLGQSTQNGPVTINLGNQFFSGSNANLNIGIANAFNGNTSTGTGNINMSIASQMVGGNARGFIGIGNAMGGNTAVMNIGIGNALTSVANNSTMNIGIGNAGGGANAVTNIGIANNITTGNTTKAYQVDIGTNSNVRGVINLGTYAANTSIGLSGNVSVTGNVLVGGIGNATVSAAIVSGTTVNASGNINMIGSNSYMVMSGANSGIQATSTANANVTLGLYDEQMQANTFRTINFAANGTSDNTSNTTINIGRSSFPGITLINLFGNLSQTGNLTVAGSLARGTSSVSNSAWTTNGIALRIPTATYTDNSTASGTQASSYVSAFNAPTLAFSNAVTVTNAATMFVAAPTAGTNATLTNSWAMIANGNVQVNGAAGVVTPNKPGFRVVGTVGTNWGPNVTITGTQGATVDYNQGNYYDNTTGTFTAPVAGLYQINISARNASNTTSISQIVAVKNLAGTSSVQTMVEFGANSTMNHAGAGTVSKLAVGDTLNLRVLVGTVQFDSNDSWSVAFLG